ncbi:hypothetical protein [Emticicia fontis]
MVTHNRILLINKIYVLLIFWFLFSSCTPSVKDEIDTLISDGDFSCEDKTSILNYINSHKEDVADDNPGLFNKSGINEKNLSDLIKSVASESGQNISLKCFDGSNEKITIKPKIYLERSGSMFPYDNPEVSSTLKESLGSLINDFEATNSSKAQLFIVNTEVFPCPVNFQQLYDGQNIFTKEVLRNLGNANYTDFNLVFKKIFSDLKEGEMGILFSDLIYSTSDGNTKNINNKTLLTSAEQLTRGAFTNYAEDNSFLLLKLYSPYKGNYYAFNSPNKGKEYNGTRPYYICFFARNNTMRVFMESEKFRQIRDFSRLPSYENFYLFSNATKEDGVRYSIIINDKENKGEFTQNTNETSSEIHRIEGITPDENGELAINLHIDLSGFHLSKGMKEDTSSYVVESPQNFKISKIQKVQHSRGWTHKITLSTKTNWREERDIIIKLKKVFPPAWITTSNTDDDTNFENPKFSTTTFGLLRLSKGINEAYNSYTKDKDNYFTIRLNLND